MKSFLYIGIIFLFFTSAGCDMFWKKNKLQNRAKAFIELPIPEGMSYVPDSLAELFIVEYANTGKVDLDEEMLEVLQIMTLEAQDTDEYSSNSEESYMKESQAILQEIMKELNR